MSVVKSVEISCSLQLGLSIYQKDDYWWREGSLEMISFWCDFLLQKSIHLLIDPGVLSAPPQMHSSAEQRRVVYEEVYTIQYLWHALLFLLLFSHFARTPAIVVKTCCFFAILATCRILQRLYNVTAAISFNFLQHLCKWWIFATSLVCWLSWRGYACYFAIYLKCM